MTNQLPRADALPVLSREEFDLMQIVLQQYAKQILDLSKDLERLEEENKFQADVAYLQSANNQLQERIVEVTYPQYSLVHAI